MPVATESSLIVLALAGKNLRISDPGVISNRHMQVLPAGAWASLNAVTSDRLAGNEEAPEALDVDVNQLSWVLTLIADHRITDRAR